MPHLLNVWPSVSEQFRRADVSLLLFDFDGTLSPIAHRPDLAVLPATTRDLLLEAQSDDRYVLGIVSGRSLLDLRERVGLDGLIYAGNHGLEIQGNGLDFLHPEAGCLREEMGRIYQELELQLGSHPGVIGENKGLSLSFHYRQTPLEIVPQVEEGFHKAVATAAESGLVKVTRGKQVLEVRPNLDWGKGRAISQIQAAHPKAQLTAFFGDDFTDEDAFAAVQQSGGVAVLVGPAGQPTRAEYRLDSPQEVAETLGLLLQP
jgi:trehalose 6-phosphate phosphatase